MTDRDQGSGVRDQEPAEAARVAKQGPSQRRAVRNRPGAKRGVCRGALEGRFANKIEQKSTFFDTDFKVFVLIIKELN